jgi:hypothetical protein
MHVIRLTATATADGILRLMVPVGEAGEFEVVVTASPKKKGGAPAAKKGPAKSGDLGDLGWSVGVADGEEKGIDAFFGDLGTDKPDPLGGLS